MNYKRLSALVAVGGMAALLSGCIVAPIGPRPYGVYPARPVYVEPVPAPGYYGYPRRYDRHNHRDRDGRDYHRDYRDNR